MLLNLSGAQKLRQNIVNVVCEPCRITHVCSFTATSQEVVLMMCDLAFCAGEIAF